MITIMPSGRLGNHLFQFAFGVAISRKLGTDFIFGTSEIESFFELRTYNNPLRKKLRMLHYMFSLKFNHHQLLDLNKDLPPEQIISMVKNNNTLYGYFQSDRFFKGCENIIKREYKIKD